MKKFITGLFRKESGHPQNIREKVSQDAMSCTQKFDQIVSEDTTPVEKIAPCPVKDPSLVEDIISHYNKDQEYDRYHCMRLIISDKIPQEKKIPFVKDALMDKEKNLLRNIYEWDSPCFKVQTELAQILADHFKETSLNTNDKDDQYQYLEFVAINGLPGCVEVIEQYFSGRDHQEYKYRNETRLPLYLARKGYCKRALELMEMFVDELERGLIDYIDDGYHPDRKEIFTFLGLSEDPGISRKAIDLGFRYYNHMIRRNTNLYSLSLFLKYIDIERYKNSLQQWLDKYEKTDTSVRSDNRDYCSFLLGEGLLVAEETGYSYWVGYVKSRGRWKDSDSTFENAMLRIARACMKGECSGDRKHEIINFILTNHRAFMKHETLKDVYILPDFFRILTTFKPDITEDEMIAFLPERYDGYRPDEDDFNINADERKPEPFEERVRIFKKHGFHEDIRLSAYDKFLGDIGRYSDFTLLAETGNMISFDTKDAYIPVDYTGLFETIFKPVLRANGIDISIHEERIRKDDEWNYTIVFSTNKHGYRIQFDDMSRYYNYEPFVKGINRLLMDGGRNLRLVYIDPGEPTTWVMFGLFDPDKLIPLAADLGFYCHAVRYNDTLMAKD